MDRYFFERLEKSEKLNQFLHHLLKQSKADEEHNLLLILEEKERLVEGLCNALETFLEAFLKKEESMFFDIFNQAYKTDYDFPYDDYCFSNETYVINILESMLSANYDPRTLACFEIRSHLAALRFFYKMIKFVTFNNIISNMVIKIDSVLTNMACHIASIVIYLLNEGSLFNYHKNRTGNSTESLINDDERQMKYDYILKSYHQIETDNKSKEQVARETLEIYKTKTTITTTTHTIKRVLKKNKFFPFS
jgi:hypothetical protein